MADVAAEAGVSQGLAYRYFPSKEEIFFTLARRALQPADELRVRAKEMRGTAGERLGRIITMMIERRRDSPEFYQFMYHVMMYEKLPKDLREAMNHHGAVAREIMRELIVEGQSAGEIARDDPDQLLGAVMACLEGLWSKIAFQRPDEVGRTSPTRRSSSACCGPTRMGSSVDEGERGML